MNHPPAQDRDQIPGSSYRNRYAFILPSESMSACHCCFCLWSLLLVMVVFMRLSSFVMCVCVGFFAHCFLNLVFTDSRSRVRLAEIPGDSLSTYINANFIKVHIHFHHKNQHTCVLTLPAKPRIMLSVGKLVCRGYSVCTLCSWVSHDHVLSLFLFRVYNPRNFPDTQMPRPPLSRH